MFDAKDEPKKPRKGYRILIPKDEILSLLTVRAWTKPKATKKRNRRKNLNYILISPGQEVDRTSCCRQVSISTSDESSRVLPCPLGPAWLLTSLEVDVWLGRGKSFYEVAIRAINVTRLARHVGTHQHAVDKIFPGDTGIYIDRLGFGSNRETISLGSNLTSKKASRPSRGSWISLV